MASVDIGQQFKFGDRGIDTIFPNVGSLVSVLLSNFYIFAGILLFILLVFGGFGMITGAGGGNPQKAEKGKNAVTTALIGFLIIFLSYWIIKIVETITGVPILDSGK